MDSEVGLNAKRQEIARVLKRMADVRNSEVLINGGGTGYRFNQEGNQVTYRCDVKRVTTINFDRKVVRNFAVEMNRRVDAVSAELDRCLVNSEVAYECWKWALILRMRMQLLDSLCPGRFWGWIGGRNDIPDW